MREQFGLSANLAVRACARVGANRKTAKQKGKPVKGFKPTSADYDARIFALREKDWTVSVTLNGGREHIKLAVANYQVGKLKGRTPTSAQLCKHRDGLYYLHIQLTDIVPEQIKSSRVIGIDFGRRDIAVTSNRDKWDGKQVKETRDKFAKVRTSLQRKASQGKRVCGQILCTQISCTKATRKGCRRALKRLSGRSVCGGSFPRRTSFRERKYQTWLNHTISRAIIRDAKTNSAIVAIENLTRIRERTSSKPRNKTERRRANSWAFFQLRQFLEYKGIATGVEVIAVPPTWTSQTCHQCLHIGARSNCKPEATSGFACERSD